MPNPMSPAIASYGASRRPRSGTCARRGQRRSLHAERRLQRQFVFGVQAVDRDGTRALAASSAPVAALMRRRPEVGGVPSPRARGKGWANARVPGPPRRHHRSDADLRLDPDLRTAAASARRSGRRLAGEDRDPSVVAYLHEKLHLDEPLPVRYLYWINGVLHGDLGESMRIAEAGAGAHPRKAARSRSNWPASPSSSRSRSAFPRASSPRSSATRCGTTRANVFALWGLSTPNFWLGIMLILLFSVTLGWLPGLRFREPVRRLGAPISRR